MYHLLAGLAFVFLTAGLFGYVFPRLFDSIEAFADCRRRWLIGFGVLAAIWYYGPVHLSSSAITVLSVGSVAATVLFDAYGLGAFFLALIALGAS